MAPEELRTVVKEAVAEALASSGPCTPRCCSLCDLEPGEHRDHHKFVGEVMGSVRDGRKAAVGVIVKTLLAVFGLGLVAVFASKLGVGR